MPYLLPKMLISMEKLVRNKHFRRGTHRATKSLVYNLSHTGLGKDPEPHDRPEALDIGT